MKIHLPSNSRTRTLLTSSRFIGATILVLGLLGASALAQTKPTDGGTPLGLQAGTPSGSYGLGGFDNVNLYNGGLNFSLPLLSVGGRGGAGHTIMLPIERRWMAEREGSDENGWLSYPVDDREERIVPGYGPGMMSARFIGTGSMPCPTPTPPAECEGDCPRHYRNTLTRLSFTGPDGTEMVFRDVQTGGVNHFSGSGTQCPVNGFGYDRGKVFVTTDGSGATFIADNSILDFVIVGQSLPEYYSTITGYMMLRDGTRYRIDDGLVSWIRDRNGNKISFSYSNMRVTTITDSLNRQVTIAYDVNEGGSYGVCDKITYKGFGGATRLIRISKPRWVTRSGRVIPCKLRPHYSPSYRAAVIRITTRLSFLPSGCLTGTVSRGAISFSTTAMASWHVS